MTVRVLALCGGVGGAKLALGLYRHLPRGELAVVINTGDDFEHLGLHVSPDIDTVLYTLADLVDRERGWGRATESWHFMDEARRFGLEDWFLLGDRDLAMHVARTRALRAGQPLSAFTLATAARLGIEAQLLPMSDDPVRTLVHSDRGTLEFQRYFVAERAAPRVQSLEYRGAERAQALAEAVQLLGGGDLQAIVLCPSNPWLSIAPMLALPALRAALTKRTAPLVAVSPIVGGAAIKGPTAKIMGELGLPVSAASIAAYYGDLLDGFVIDSADAALAPRIGTATRCAATVMRHDGDKSRLAAQVLEFAAALRR